MPRTSNAAENVARTLEAAEAPKARRSASKREVPRPDTSAMREKEASETREHLEEIRAEIDPATFADMVIKDAEAMYASFTKDLAQYKPGLQPIHLEARQDDFRRKIGQVEKAIAGLQAAKTNTPAERNANREKIEELSDLIHRLESIIPLTELDPEDARSEYLAGVHEEIPTERAQKRMRTQLEARHTDLSDELAELKRTAKKLEKEIQDSGVYGAGMNTDQILGKSGNYFAQTLHKWRVGFTDFVRGLRKESKPAAELGQALARIREIENELDFRPVEKSATEEQIEGKAKIQRERYSQDRYKKLRERKREEQRSVAAELPDSLLGKTAEEAERELGLQTPEEKEEKQSQQTTHEVILTQDETKKKAEEAAKIDKRKAEMIREVPLPGPMTIKEAGDILPNAKELYDVIDRARRQHPEARITGAKADKEAAFDPTLKVVFEIAKYQRLLQSGDPESIEEQSDKVKRLLYKIDLDPKEHTIALALQKPVERVSDQLSQRDLEQLQELLSETNPAGDTYRFYKLLGDVLSLRETDPRRMASDQELQQMLADMDLQGNALIRKILSTESGIKNVTRGAKERQRNSTRREQRFNSKSL